MTFTVRRRPVASLIVSRLQVPSLDSHGSCHPLAEDSFVGGALFAPVVQPAALEFNPDVVGSWRIWSHSSCKDLSIGFCPPWVVASGSCTLASVFVTPVCIFGSRASNVCNIMKSSGVRVGASSPVCEFPAYDPAFPDWPFPELAMASRNSDYVQTVSTLTRTHTQDLSWGSQTGVTSKLSAECAWGVKSVCPGRLLLWFPESALVKRKFAASSKTLQMHIEFWNLSSKTQLNSTMTRLALCVWHQCKSSVRLVCLSLCKNLKTKSAHQLNSNVCLSSWHAKHEMTEVSNNVKFSKNENTQNMHPPFKGLSVLPGTHALSTEVANSPKFVTQVF